MAAKRDEYVDKLKSQLDQWNAEMAKWEAQAGTTQEKMRAEYDRQLTALRQHRNQALEQLRKVQSASGEAWTEFARGADESWAKMRDAIEKAGTRFKK